MPEHAHAGTGAANGRGALHPVDQAHGLRRLFARQTVRLLPLVASAGWPDAQALALDLAMRWAQDGRHVLVLDGLSAQRSPWVDEATAWDLDHVLQAQVSFEDAAQAVVPGVWLMAAQEGLPSLVRDGHAARSVLQAAAQLPQGIDMVILLAGAPIVAALCAGEAVLPLVLGGDAPADMTDAYLALKILATEGGLSRCGLVLTDRGAPARVQMAAQRITTCAQRFLGGDVHLAATVPLHGAQTEPALQALARRAVDHALSRDVDAADLVESAAVHAIN